MGSLWCQEKVEFVGGRQKAGVYQCQFEVDTYNLISLKKIIFIYFKFPQFYMVYLGDMRSSSFQRDRTLRCNTSFLKSYYTVTVKRDICKAQIVISVGIIIIVACSVCMCKGATETVSKEMLQTQADIFHSENTVPCISMKKSQKIELHP